MVENDGLMDDSWMIEGIIDGWLSGKNGGWFSDGW